MEEHKSKSPMAKAKPISAPNSPFVAMVRPLPITTPSELTKQLEDARIIQRTLVYIINLPSGVSDEETLSNRLYFGKYGKILKIHISQGHHTNSDPTYGAYLTYSAEEEAAVCIRACHEFVLEGKRLIVTFGTTKYCSYFLKNSRCPKAECVFLHHLANKADTKSREDMNTSRHIQPLDSILDKIKVNISPPIPPSKLPEAYIIRDRAVSEIIQVDVSPPQRSRILSNSSMSSRYKFTIDGNEDEIQVPHCIEVLRTYASPCKDSAVIPSKNMEEIFSPTSPFRWAADVIEVTPHGHIEDNVVVSVKKFRASL